MPRSRTLRAAFLALVLPFALAGVACAEWEDPPYGRTDLALTDETLPEGWSLLEESDPALAAGAGVVAAVVKDAATEAGLPPAEREVLVQGLKGPAGAVVTVALVDVFLEPSKFVAALKPRAEKAGLAVREMASPARLLLVSAPPDRRAEVVAFHVKGSARLLGKRALASVDERLPEQAEILSKASLALEPRAALPRLVRGLVAAAAAGKDEGEMGKALAEIESSLGEGAAIPLDATERVRGLGTVGEILLLRKTAEADAKARDALKVAVEIPSDLTKQTVAGYRYNLACAHARLKETDLAFSNLKAVLEVDKTLRLPGIQHWRKDPDFDSLKADPRWQALLDEYGKTDDTTRE